MTQMKPLGAQISLMLKERGVDVIFGIPGVHNQEMYRGIEEAGIKHVLARHEQGAGFMADGYARASGRPGVAYVITGPGLCNIMTPMGQAYSDSVSMLVISSCLDEVSFRRGQLHQMLDQEGAGRSVCDWSEQADSVDATYGLIDRAFLEFKTKRPRSKHIQVPIQLLEGLAHPAPRPKTATKSTGINPNVVTGVAQKLGQSQKPLFIFGGGCHSDGAVVSARELVGKLGAASFTTYAGRGVVGPDTEFHFGPFLARPSSADIIAQADLVIAVGTELSEVDLWRDDLGHTSDLIRVDIDPEALTDLHRAEGQIHADAGEFLSAINAVVAPQSSDWQQADVADVKSKWRAETDSERPHIVSIAGALRAALPQDTMIFSDMTQFAYVAKEVWEMDRPGFWHHPSGFGTLGYAMPAAIGGAVARKGAPTLAIAGDYGFQYTVQELGAAVELGLPLPIIVWDNGKLKEIEESMQRAQIAPNAVIAHNPDFLALAQAYGCDAVAPSSLDDLCRAVGDAFNADRPTVIHVTPDILG